MTTSPCPHCGLPIDAPGDENPFAPPRAGPSTMPASGKPALALSLVAPYAVLMTVVAATFAYKFHSARLEHPLAIIPDLVGEYRNASQRKAGAHSIPLPKPDQPLPAHLITTLGKPLTIGQIEVTPLTIEERSWTAFSRRKDKPEPVTVPIKETLVLTLRVKNVSADVLIYPADPFFDRRPHDGDKAMPFTLIEAGGKKFFGGVIAYITERGPIEREWLAGRESDGVPLNPGEAREIVIVTQPAYAAEIAAMLHKSAGEAIWRVHLRRGLYEFNGQEFSVAAVIGVRFSARNLAPG